MMKTVSVIPLKKGVLKEELTYFTAQEIALGSIVSIPIRNKKILGLVISVENVQDTKSSIKGMDFNLKKIEEIKEQSIFRPELIESIFLISQYFVTKKNIGITSLIPTVLKEEYDEISTLVKKNNLTEKSPQSEIKKIKSEKLLFQGNMEDRISYYKTLIRESFAQKKSIFFVLPTEHDIDIFRELLSKGIENFCVSIHGNLSAKKQIENIKKIIENSHPILVLATAPFLAIPRNDFATIILEHESSNAYKMMAKPNFDLKIYVEIFAEKTNAKFVLADSLLSLDSIGRKELDNFGEIRPMSFKINFEGNLEVLPPSGGKTSKFEIFSPKVLEEIKNNLAKGENIFIFSLRKGLASITICRDCNQEVLCEDCSAPLVLYLSRDGQKRMFACNRCKKEANTETICKRCGSWNLMPLGIGTDTVYEECKKQFPKVKIFKLDKETVKTTKQAESMIKEFSAKGGSASGGEDIGKILIGTEMALFYLKNEVALSVIASFDSLWSIPNYKISEKVIQILISLMNKTSKKLIIQTKNEQDPAIVAIRTLNLLSFIREELTDRQNLGYPPYKRFIKINFLGDKEETTQAKRIIGEMFKEYNPVIFSGFIAKQKGKYATNALIKLGPKKWSLPELSSNATIDQNLFGKLSSLPSNFSITIDPEDLL